MISILHTLNLFTKLREELKTNIVTQGKNYLVTEINL